MPRPTPTDLLGLDWAWNGNAFLVTGKSIRRTDPTEYFFNGAGVYFDAGALVVNEAVTDSALSTQTLAGDQTSKLIEQMMAVSITSGRGILKSAALSAPVLTDFAYKAFMNSITSMASAIDGAGVDVSAMISDMLTVLDALGGSRANTRPNALDSASASERISILLQGLSIDALNAIESVTSQVAVRRSGAESLVAGSSTNSIMALIVTEMAQVLSSIGASNTTNRSAAEAVSAVNVVKLFFFRTCLDQLASTSAVTSRFVGKPMSSDRITGADTATTTGSMFRVFGMSLTRTVTLLRLYWDKTANSSAGTASTTDGSIDLRALMETVRVNPTAVATGVLGLSAASLAAITEKLALHWNMTAVDAAAVLDALTYSTDVRELVERLAMVSATSAKGVLGLSAQSSTRLGALLASVWDMNATSAVQALILLSSIMDIRSLVERVSTQVQTSTQSKLAGTAQSHAALGELLAQIWDTDATSALQVLALLTSTIDLRALLERLAFSDASVSRGIVGLSAQSSARLANLLASIWDMDVVSTAGALATLSSMLNIRALVERIAVQALTATQGSSLSGTALERAQFADLLAVLWDMDGASAAAFIPALTHSIDLRVLTERIVATDALVARAAQKITAQSVVTAAEALRIAWNALAVEAATLADLSAADPLRIVALVESLVAADAVKNRLDAGVVLAIAAMFVGRSEAPLTADVIEAFAASELWSAKLVSNAVLVNAILLAADISVGRAVILKATTLAVLAENASPSQILNALASDTAGVDIELLLGGEAYQGWAVRTDTLAATEYQQFPFNSMCRLENQYFGASEDGFFLLDGDTDDGQPIQARILTGELDFSTAEMKRIDRAYLGYTTSGDMVLKVIATHAGKKTEYWYRAPMLVRHEPTETRVPIGRGIVSRYLQFELCNVDGADFELDRMDLEVLNLTRRV